MIFIEKEISKDINWNVLSQFEIESYCLVCFVLKGFFIYKNFILHDICIFL